MAKKDVLDIIKGNVTITTDGSHPAESLDIEGKNHYLNALAVLAAIDDNFSIAKKEYLKKIIARLKLNEEKLEELIEIGNEPTEDIISEFMDYFKKSETIYHLLIDCFTLTELDGEADESVNQMIDLIFQNSNIISIEKELLKKLPEIIKTQKTEKAFNLLIDDLELFTRFKPILLPYGIDLVKHFESIKRILDFETEEWLIEYEPNYFEELEYLPAKEPITNEQFVLFLNYVKDTQDRKDIKLDFNVENAEITIKDDTYQTFYKQDYIKGVTLHDIYEFVSYVQKITLQKISLLKLKFPQQSLRVHSGIIFNLPGYEGSSLRVNKQNLDELIMLDGQWYYLNKGGHSYSNYAGHRKRFIEYSSGVLNLENDTSHSNLTYRLMKKVEPLKTENKPKK